jgi:Tfp pilus assembly protein PilN
VKAVNLIPAEDRRGGGTAGVSLAAYGLLAGLAVALGALTLYVLTSNRLEERTSELAALKARNVRTDARASALEPYIRFAKLERDRVSTVRNLAASRFDWSRVMTDLSRVVGRRVWLTAMTGTVAPGVSVEGGSASDASSLRQALPNPAVELDGCATDHREVVRFVSRLRATKAVVRVTLADSQKSDTQTQSVSSDGGSGGSSAPGSSTGCGSDSRPQFNLIVFYAPLPGGAPPTSAGGGSTPATPPTSGGSTAPSTSTPPTTTPSSSPPSKGTG